MTDSLAPAVTVRHIDLVKTDAVYRVLSETRDYWHNVAESIMDGARADVSLYAANRYEAEADAKRRAYLTQHGIVLG